MDNKKMPPQSSVQPPLPEATSITANSALAATSLAEQSTTTCLDREVAVYGTLDVPEVETNFSISGDDVRYKKTTNLPIVQERYERLKRKSIPPIDPIRGR